MKANIVFRCFFITTILTMVMLIMQSCGGSLFENEMRRIVSGEEVEVDTTPSEDLEFWGLNNEDWQSVDDPFVE